MKIHFIAIGGSAMHNLAIALSRKGNRITGSDDEIFEPSRSRLEREGILPKNVGWEPEKLTSDIDAVVLGMHARADNPELLKAKELGIPAPAIQAAFDARLKSQEGDTHYGTRFLAQLRNEFGGHDINPEQANSEETA
jgi:UDP-N-acetylmuramate-alanine ligase